MAHYTLIARINTGDGKFPFPNVQFSKSHGPIPIENATYYIRSSSGKRTPIKIGKDITVAHSALIRMEVERDSALQQVHTLCMSQRVRAYGSV